MIVIDASVVASALGDDGHDGDIARERILMDPDLHAPHLMDLEVMSVLRRLSRVGRLDDRRVSFALRDLVDLSIVRYPHLAFAYRIWELRQNATVYDAAYLALAETLQCTFVTADRALATLAGVDCEVELLSATGS